MTSTDRHVTRVGKGNEVTIPADLLRELGVGPGERVEMLRENGSVVLRKPNRSVDRNAVDRAYGILHDRDRDREPLTDDELEDAIREASQEAATRRYLRSFDGE